MDKLTQDQGQLLLLLSILQFTKKIQNGKSIHCLQAALQIHWLKGIQFLSDFLGLAGGPTLYLHDIENALSNLVSAVLWAAGHIKPPPLTMKYGFFNTSEQSTPQDQEPPSLAVGYIPLSTPLPAARLDLNCCVQAHTCLDGMGLLQMIWIFQHHPKLDHILDEVEDPTTHNLRMAGMVDIQLVEALEN
ncbi:hypothetical protein K438DRAFT_1774428 [Mycena galopus ATCC 62051]|nr:hypothetical protein K438DRAFT_1774428 [Mycena galopus ATCC 62051]